MNWFELMHTPCDAPLRIRELERQRAHDEFMKYLQSDEFKKIAEQVAAQVSASSGTLRIMTTSNIPPTEADRLRAACRAVECREASCRKPIIWLRNPATGKTVPCDAATVGADHDHYDRTLGHVSHFLTCTAPGRFSKGKR